MNPPQNNNNQTFAGLLQVANFPAGIIQPRALVASTVFAAGDIFYITSKGIFARLPIGTANQLLMVSSSGLPEWGDTTGYSGSVIIPKINSTQGSLTVVDGRITSYTAPT